MKPNLTVTIGKLKLANPVMAASGTFGEEYGELVDVASLGAVVAKTITLKERIGNAPPRVAETASGMLNSIGLENKGLDHFVREKLPALARLGTTVIASIAGDDEDEFCELARRLAKTKLVGAIEINLSCPNIRYGDRSHVIAQDAEATGSIVRAVRAVTNMTLITKLSPHVTDIKQIAGAAADAGSDALTVANTFVGMAIDIETRRPRLGNITGGLSGPAIKPIALRMVWEASRAVKVPVIGCGGIADWRDALEFIIAGATAIQVGTANFVDPRSAAQIVDGLRKYAAAHKIGRITQMVGSLEMRP